MTKLAVITRATIQPVTYGEAADHLRVDCDDDKDYISALIPVASEYVSGLSGMVGGETAFRATLDDWNGGEISLARSPVVSVQSVSYYAPGSTVLTVMDPADYVLTPEGVEITADLPALDARTGAVQVDFTAGHETPEDMPPVFKHAVKIALAHFYEQRVPVAFASAVEIPHTLRALINHTKTGGWF